MALASGAASFSVRAPASGLRPRAAAAAAGAGGVRYRSDGSGNGNGKLLAPLLGWSGQPDYIDAAAAEEEEERPSQPGAKRFAVLTEEKARQLRMRMMETENFHDAMYHSAIASRLASPAPPDSKP